MQLRNYFIFIVCLGIGGVPGYLLADSFSGEITRALFSTKVRNNKPANEVLILENNVKKIFFYSEINNAKDTIISHRWEFQGKKIHEEKFTVKPGKSQLISSIMLQADRTGEWMVIVSDEKNWPIKAAMFKYVRKGSFAGKGIIPVR